MILRKYRWSRHYESAEEELLGILKAKHIDAERWHAEEYEVFSTHKHALDKQLWCAEGSITFSINGVAMSLQTGDTLDLPAGIEHSAQAGISGCVCYEFPRIADNPSIN